MQYCFCIIRHNMKHKDFSQILKRKSKIKSAPLQQPVSCCNEAKNPKNREKNTKFTSFCLMLGKGCTNSTLP